MVHESQRQQGGREVAGRWQPGAGEVPVVEQVKGWQCQDAHAEHGFVSRREQALQTQQWCLHTHPRGRGISPLSTVISPDKGVCSQSPNVPVPPTSVHK